MIKFCKLSTRKNNKNCIDIKNMLFIEKSNSVIKNYNNFTSFFKIKDFEKVNVYDLIKEDEIKTKKFVYFTKITE